MATAINTYNPDYVVLPGWLLEEHLEVSGVSHAEFARRCGRSAKLISEIIAGKAPVEPETALQFEKVLGVSANIWLGIEADYQLHVARKAEEEKAAHQQDWLTAFPVKELISRGYINKPGSPAEAISEVLSFFKVGTVDAWLAKYSSANVAYRHSPTFRSDEVYLATWLRMGELLAEETDCAEYCETKFKNAVHEVRGLTREPVDEALARAMKLCNEAGVVLALVKPLPKTALSGAARWHSPRKAIVQLSARHNTDDHLWFSFFHEAAHIILHSKKSVFVNATNRAATNRAATNRDDEELEVQANEWASNALVPRAAWRRFVATQPTSEVEVQAFANEQGIAPGIVVGMLQHEGVVDWSHLNNLKVRLK